MNLQQLEYIVAVDRLKSFSKAAEACYITQATLSTMVKRLEEELDMVIFDRKGNPVITTDCGKELLREAQLAVHHANRMKQLSAELKGIIEGELNIGIIPTVAGNLLHRILPVILKKYPRLKLNIHESTTANITARLKTNELDAGIVSTPLNHEHLEEDILYYEKLMVYGKSDKGTTKFKSPKNMASENVWLLEKGNCLTDQIINVCALNSKSMHSNLNFHPNSFESLLNVVDNMKGLTLIPELYYLDLPKQRKKHVTDFVAPYPVREISLVYHRPYAKLRLLNAVSDEIKRLIPPMLETGKLKNREMTIAKI